MTIVTGKKSATDLRTEEVDLDAVVAAAAEEATVDLSERIEGVENIVKSPAGDATKDAFRVRDKKWNTPFRVLGAAFGWRVVNKDIDQIRANAEQAIGLIGGLPVYKRDRGFFSFWLRDPNGWVGFAIDKVTAEIKSPTIRRIDALLASVTAQISALVAELFSLNANGPNSPYRNIGALYDICHLILYGQSLSIGQGGVPAVSHAAIAAAMRFNGGVYPLDGGSDPAVTQASFVPAIDPLTLPPRESAVYGMMRMIIQLLQDEDGIDIATLNQQFLLTTPGYGSQSMEELMNPTNYARMESAINRGKSVAAGLNKSYGVSLGLMMQGEEDNGNQTPEATYKADFLLCWQMIKDTASAAMGYTIDLPMVTYQTSSHRGDLGRRPNVALAQLDLAETHPWFAMSTPTYFMEYADTVHMKAISYLWIGAYMGIVAKRWLFDKRKIANLVPTDHHVQPMGADTCKVILTFGAAEGQLVLDTTMVADPGNYGFQIVDTANLPLTISNVKVIGRNKVSIDVAASAASVGAERYAWVSAEQCGAGPAGTTGPRGCLRDSRAIVFDPSGDNLPCPNFAPIHHRSLI